MATAPLHKRTRPSVRRQVVDWIRGPHLPLRHPALAVYSVCTATAMGYIVSLLAPLAR